MGGGVHFSLSSASWFRMAVTSAYMACRSVDMAEVLGVGPICGDDLHFGFLPNGSEESAPFVAGGAREGRVFPIVER